MSAADDAHGKYDHERTDVTARWPIYIGIGMLLTLPITVAIISALMSSVWAPPQDTGRPDIELPTQAADAPRLQTDPQGDLSALRQQWDERLHGTGWVDRDAGIAYIPIEQAEQRLLDNGLPQNTNTPPASRARIGESEGTASHVDRAGSGTARPARNEADPSGAVPYRGGEMAR